MAAHDRPLLQGQVALGTAWPAGEGGISHEDEVKAVIASCLDRFGRLDILVANAGVQRDAAIGEMTLAQWQQVLAINLTGQFLCARAALRCFARQGADPDRSRAAGKIICMSSVHRVIPWAGHVSYAASKGGVELLMIESCAGGGVAARPCQRHRSGRHR